LSAHKETILVLLFIRSSSSLVHCSELKYSSNSGSILHRIFIEILISEPASSLASDQNTSAMNPLG